MILYNIKRGPHGFAIGKFDEDLNLLAAYNTDLKYCSCPAGPRPSCRHRKMLPRMISRVDTDEFYCYETQTWHLPLAREALGSPMTVELPEQPAEPLVSPALQAQVGVVDQPQPPLPSSALAPTIRRR